MKDFILLVYPSGKQSRSLNQQSLMLSNRVAPKYILDTQGTKQLSHCLLVKVWFVIAECKVKFRMNYGNFRVGASSNVDSI